MRKIIITVIATIVLIAPFEKTKGQEQWEYRVVSADFPTTNILTGATGKLSLRLWRFEPFVQFGAYLQMFEERMTTETWHYTQNWIPPQNPWGNPEYYWDWGLFLRDEIHSPRFQSMATYNIGVKFRVTDRDRIMLGFTSNNFGGNLYRLSFYDLYLGYIRRENLSQRLSVELSALFASPSWGGIMVEESWGFSRFRHSFVYGFVAVGAGLNYEIFPNLKLGVQLKYTRRFDVRFFDFERSKNTSGERLLTRNLLDFSIGIHYHIPIFGGQQQAQQRQPRQRVAPHQRALPCPPGQMRHNRSWDRPSSVFNHPSGR